MEVLLNYVSSIRFDRHTLASSHLSRIKMKSSQGGRKADQQERRIKEGEGQIRGASRFVDKKPSSVVDRPQTYLAGLLCLSGIGVLELLGTESLLTMGGVQYFAGDWVW